MWGGGRNPAMIRGQRCLFGGSAFVLSALIGHGAAAQQAAPKPDGEAIKLYEEGVKAARAGQWERARQALLGAFVRRPDARTAANLGRVETMASKPRDAAEHLSFFLQQAPEMSEKDRQVTREMIARAQAKIGTVMVHVDAEGADVLVDGQKVGSSPLPSPLFVDPGTRRFEARKAGMRLASQEIEVTAGSAPRVDLQLSSTAVSPPADQRPAALNSGSGAGPDTSGEKVNAPWKALAIASGGISLAGIGAGIALSVAAGAKFREAGNQLDALRQNTLTTSKVCGPSSPSANAAGCASLKSTLSSRDHLTNAATAGFIVGGAAAVGTVVFLLVPKLKPRRAAVEVTPSIGGNQGGVTLSGSF